MLGQVNALTQQIQRETNDARTLSQEEQALTKKWMAACTSLNISWNIQDDITPWLNEQERYERQQLYQLSQRLTLQSQLNEQEAQERQYQQQLAATRQALEHAPARLSLNAPEEGTEAAWLHARESEFAQWQAQQAQHDAIQQRKTPCGHCSRRCRPATRQQVEAEPAIPDNWREIHENACRCTASLSPSSSRKPGKGRLDQSQAQFTSALAASRFADRDAFLAALLDDDAAQRPRRS